MKTVSFVATGLLTAWVECGMSEDRGAHAVGTGATFPGQKSSFHGFDQYDFELEGRGCKVVVPKQAAEGKPWIWRAQFWGHEPQVDIALLEQGYHLVYAKVGNSFGSPAALQHWDDLYEYLRFEHLLVGRPCGAGGHEPRGPPRLQLGGPQPGQGGLHLCR